MPQDDPDATIKVRRTPDAVPLAVAAPRQPPGSHRHLGLAALALSVALAAGAWWLLRPAPQPAPVAPPAVPVAPPAVPAPPPVVSAPPAPAPPAVALPPLRDEAAILGEHVDAPTLLRFEPNPHIYVLDFPSLRSQGLALNRIAAFVEKAGQPRDRVLTDAELAAAIKADDATVETYYYGHDYRGADVLRFFAVADQQGLPLFPEERALQAMLAHTVRPGSTDWAVITIPREGSDKFVDLAGRRSLLRHELSHGEYFTTPAYAAFVNDFWHQTLTDPDRQAFVAFLVRQGYDPTNEDLVINEMQAHLMHTTDGRYFNAQVGGFAPERLRALRQAFLAAMPKGWLEAADQATLPELP